MNSTPAARGVLLMLAAMFLFSAIDAVAKILMERSQVPQAVRVRL